MKGTSNVTVQVTPEGHIPIPPELQKELGLASQQPVTLRAEGGFVYSARHPTSLRPRAASETDHLGESPDAHAFTLA